MGIDGLALLGWKPEDASDPTALLVAQAVVERAWELKERSERSLAYRIVGALADALKKR